MADDAASRYDAFAEEEEASIEEPVVEVSTLDLLHAQFGDAIQERSTRLGEPTAIVDPKALVEVMTWLRDAQGFVLLSDLTAHDCHGEEPRFWVVYQLRNLETTEFLRIKVGVPEKKPVVDTVVPVWPGANYMEREVYDLFGIEFKGHPDLRRILLPPEWDGYPLRKDYPIVYEPIEFTHNAAEVRLRKPFAER